MKRKEKKKKEKLSNIGLRKVQSKNKWDRRSYSLVNKRKMKNFEYLTEGSKIEKKINELINRSRNDQSEIF